MASNPSSTPFLSTLPITEKLGKALTKDEKKEYGIFFTPPSIISDFFTHVIPELSEGRPYQFLEPSCGSCEFISYFEREFPKAHTFDAIEFNKTVYEEIIKEKFPNTTYLNQDFLYYDLAHTKKYDLIIGNPPYFVCETEKVPLHMRPKKGEKHDKYDGRIQIFVLFLIHALEKLEPNGILAFILPKSILNSAYYMKTRKYIYENFELLKIIDYGSKSFEDTSQETVGIIIKNNKKKNPTYIFQLNSGMDLFFTYRKAELEKLYEGASTLVALGFHVKTGPVVWNQHKEKMRSSSDTTGTVPHPHPILIYNTNISKDNKLMIKEFKNDEKKQYIALPEKAETSLPIIVCNRGNGNSKYKLTCAYIDEEVLTKELGLSSTMVCVENHLNVISYPKGKKSQEEITKMMKRVYEEITNSEKITQWCDIFLGNNGFSKTELENYLPISI